MVSGRIDLHVAACMGMKRLSEGTNATAHQFITYLYSCHAATVQYLKLKLQGLWFNKKLLKEWYSSFIAHNLERHLFCFFQL